MSHPRLQVTNARKQFPGVLALGGVSLTLAPGEVLAVVGENGAGKSTLMKIVAGVYTPDAGAVQLDGRPVQFRGPADAIAAGVSLIHQELNLAENLTVVDNLFLGREVTRGGALRVLDRAAMTARAAGLLDRVGLPANRAQARVESLPPGEKQLVEIARALGTDVRVLIMDEPTSSLTQKETEQLYRVIDALKAAGVSVLYISHRLAEVRRVADRAVVLRDGQNAGELARGEITHDNLVRLMVGRDLKQFYPKTHRTGAGGAPVLSVRGVRYRNGPATPASFEVRAGEILGMAGLVGAGRTELSEAVFGVRQLTAGELLLNGEPARIGSPRDAIASGVLLVPEDRRLHGLVLAEGVGFNLSLPNLDRLGSPLGVNRRAEAELHRTWIDRLRVKTPRAAQPVGLLSGGNQQKVVYGKWLARGPRVLILDEPTRGVDVGAKAEIYALIDELAGRGVAVWMITSDMEELLGMSDRVVVMHEGRVAGELLGPRVTEEAVMRLATGGTA
ncbi:Ribose import ATP-binding protein RbsA [Gemmata obscuriglobus]|uniref:D-xylose ABC transporter ATP-binding protein n=1 Tax=Gemmata obscuriglobus TaxID=114 RepID=A0A2Z3GR29_9BACT|nr:sugar ABC transporter ATP-binding protein [Gemmata obscuriglobus]AWM35748.1 D-xylose ABC transporter ATP-binding protein [Gemmata obscuriglobus]QEG31715.1 Ribose import ATP-binding protein RbsA [Gemmata obscuriglobus]VTS11061.1 d-ribose transporter atp binding protein : Ribose import ATP-binding protein RbsA OS=Blastopirellula marina DSM 3645 GN=rbsA PE=3 SV=1: ABC_tran: ABC_tran [Gemmata obscuriglobus UQM 2246]